MTERALLDRKEFATLAAEFALCGHALIRASEADGQAPYYAVRWGWLKPLPDLDAARQLLDQIRGGGK